MNLRSLLRQPVLTVAMQEREARWSLGARHNVSALGCVTLPPGLIDDGVVRDPAATGAVLRDCADFPGRGRMRVLVALPAQRAVFRTIDLPAVRGAAFAELAAREIRREMPMLAENAYISWKRMADAGTHAQLFVVGVARDVLDSHVAALRAAGLQPLSADLRVIAAARSLGTPDCIVADVEATDIEVAIVRAGVPAIVRPVAMSALPDDPAWAQQLAEELARTIKFYRDSHRDDEQFDALPISIVGGAAAAALAGGTLAAATGHDVVSPQLAALGRLPAGERLRFAANLGLAAKDLAA